jgi:hypothetical protein
MNHNQALEELRTRLQETADLHSADSLSDRSGDHMPPRAGLRNGHASQRC